MKTCVVVLAISLVASACVPPPVAVPITSFAPSATPASTVAGATPPTVSARPVAYRVLSSVPGRATVSPDGRWIATSNQQSGASPVEAVHLFTTDGTPVRDVRDAGTFWGWLSDSTGLFVATSLPQHAPPMGIIDLDGRVIVTELLLSHPTLSRDGELIAAEHQEGCCASVIQREIRVARRDGGGTRALVLSESPGSQGVVLLGIDGSDRAVYGDGTKVMRIPLAGGTTTTLGTSSDYARVLQGSTSPDGMAIFARGYEPTRWYLIANDRVAEWDDTLGTIVEDGNPGLTKSGATTLWTGPHAFLARDTSGSLFSVDALTYVRTPQAGRLVTGDVVLADQHGTLLVVRGGVVVLLDTSTGAVRGTGLDLRPDAEGAQAAALPSGGFVLSSSSDTYRID
jgi:hypothetical protein